MSGITNFEENPLISPCKCSGTMKYIHFFCLQKWIANKTNLNSENGVITILWEYFNCELCKFRFSFKFKSPKGNFLNLFDLFSHKKIGYKGEIDYISI